MKNDIFTENSIKKELKKITNQIYKLLPLREENQDWYLPLQTIIEELAGLRIVDENFSSVLFPLICKLQGLTILVRDEDFFLFRRTVFECLSLVGEMNKDVS